MMAAATVVCYIGLGSNLAGKYGEPVEHIKKAASQLDDIEQTQRITLSPLYGSTPLGPQDQPDYVNAVAELKTELSAEQLLDALQHIEQMHERVRSRHWGPRTLDLDILLYGDVEIDDERLRVPHPGLCEREFVVRPLLNIAPQLVVPTHGKLSEIVRSCPPQGLSLIGEIA